MSATRYHRIRGLQYRLSLIKIFPCSQIFKAAVFSSPLLAAVICTVVCNNLLIITPYVFRME